ncbi:hypothetical protein Clacol_007602 [Clathrus columnatus]|uniref:DUF6534 domain-containing protein n=1 Tax=Clathrus columnatus TaxID=1419009 RepID=A0AAV5AG88_9AGAM|nr:hypothetical protein Clacol_007602 [Clathrus columnatus]
MSAQALSSPVDLTLPHSFDNTLGALLIGLIVSTALFGLTTLQTYLYFINYIKDRLSLKFLVASLWILDFIHTILVTHASYHYLIVNFMNPLGLLHGECERRPHNAVRLLIVYTIETGLLTSVLVIVDAVFALTMPQNWIFIVYSNSFLTILNSRRSLRSKFGSFTRRTTKDGSKQAVEERLVSISLPEEDHHQLESPHTDIHLLEMIATSILSTIEDQ